MTQKIDWWKIIILLAIAFSAVFFIMNKAPQSEVEKETLVNIPQETIMKSNNVILKTNYGDIELEFFADKAPNTVNNFVTLAEQGFYNGIKFHRVIENFMIQGGDPFSKDDSNKDMWGKGGPGYKFEDEIHDENRNITGTISMANAGANTNGSQFFINVADNNMLDPKHTVFGKVVSGMDVVMEISKVPTEPSPIDRPLEPVIIEEVIVK
ncbi:peptidylprolyl isomerase [Patescibacteria group bacterium]